MAAKPLPSQAYLRECFSYDRETGVLTWRVRPREHFKDAHNQFRWNNTNAGRPVRYINGQGYLVATICGYPTLAHRIIYKFVVGQDPKLIDHKNCNRADNRWENLRLADSLKNAYNGGGKRRVNDWLKGVKKQEKGGRWRATINVNYKRIDLGTYDTEQEAHQAYCDAATRLHGDFANHG